MNKLNITILEIFYFLSISSVILAALELAMPGMVSAYLDLNFLLILWVISGMMILFIQKEYD